MPDEPRTFAAGGPVGNGGDTVLIFEPGCDYLILPIRHPDADDRIIRGED